jgi:hypothetical protein
MQPPPVLNIGPASKGGIQQAMNIRGGLYREDEGLAIAWWFLFLILVITSSHIAAQPYRTNKIYYVPVTNLQIPILENEKWGSGGCDAILSLYSGKRGVVLGRMQGNFMWTHTRMTQDGNLYLEILHRHQLDISY